MTNDVEEVSIVNNNLSYKTAKKVTEEGLPLLLDIYSKYDELVATFTGQSISIVEMTPEEHDRDAAMSQGITHFMGRVLKESGVSSTKINTLGFNELLGVIEQTCNDSWDLFLDLQNYNPFTNEMVKKIEHGIEVVRKQIGEIK